MDDDPTEAPIRYHDRMSDEDALMWSIEKDPMLRSTITTVILLERPIDRETLRRTFERLTRVVPRLRQRVRSNLMSLAPPRWEIDPNFDLDYHLRAARVPGEGTLRDLLRMTQPIAVQGFDRARPQWECTAVDGLADGRDALILKFHHAMTDGVGGVRLMLELFDLTPDAPERAMPPAPPVHVLNQTERFTDALAHQARTQVGLLRELSGAGIHTLTSAVADPVGTFANGAELAASAARVLRPSPAPMSPIMSGRSLSSHLEALSLPLDLAKKAGKRVGGSLNDTYVTGLVRGLQLYHGRHGASLQDLRMGMPINVRSGEMTDTAGNAFVPARFEIPVHAQDVIELMRTIRRRMMSARDEPANQLVEPVANLLNRLPTTVVTQVFGSMMKGLDFQASNVPGSPVPVYLRGIPVEAVIPFGPLAGAACNVTLLSYQNDLNIGLNIDPAAVPDPESFIECVRLGYDEVLDLA
ncbi:wax ester/triacylglycerol synthase domain-containing protein [Dermatobacter hominis]|uniref:wax ester/triacylglycerol synthase domain-containing protein n=1 Tax=Dermatobacter hominis TaxID=2884263 RepID=UPI001D10EFD0|nr:wax ester/triacylglycerol synthase domain-containing protein [Dermatobacter hominis]UDY36938.1 WS/DGAT domain-containing protein [Dermatobacter hominis]